jgi:two-component system, response regulator PdtaR
MPDKKIFIVEDEPIVAMTLEDTLAQLGYVVAGTATNGRDALEQIGETHPDLILMDIRIEGELDGIETAEKVTTLYHIPVVYLTAHSDEKTLERAMATQPHGYLLKPFRTRELYSTIEIALYKNRLASRGSLSPPPVTGPRLEPVEKPSTITLEQAILNTMDSAIFVVNRDLKLVYSNPAFGRLCSRLGLPPPINGRSLANTITPALVGWTQEYTAVFETMLESRKSISCVIENEAAAFSFSKIPLAEQGSVSYVAGILTDASRERFLTERMGTLNANNEILLSHLRAITSLTSGKEDPAMKEISRHVGEIVIAITKLDTG